MRKRFLLIGWDAADWNFFNPQMDSGQLPALNARRKRSASFSEKQS